MLNRWLAYKRDLNSGGSGKKNLQRGGGGHSRRPTLTTEVETVGECERWRMSLIREMGRKVMEIQNESLGEQRIRDLNDDINKLLREKAHWERRIIELGGPNYRKYERIADDALLSELEPTPGSDHFGHTYKYFGAAKNLPAVKEMFAKKEKETNKRKRADMRGIDATYFGYRDDEDGLLEDIEQQAEKKALTQAMKDWQKEQNLGKGDGVISHHEDQAPLDVVVPTKEQMSKALLEKKKQDLQRKYGQDVKGVIYK